MTPDETGRTLSPGEVAPSDLDEPAGQAPTSVDVVVGKLPSEEDATTMFWTAVCSVPEHDLVGRFETREQAEQAREEHLRAHRQVA